MDSVNNDAVDIDLEATQRNNSQPAVKAENGVSCIPPPGKYKSRVEYEESPLRRAIVTAIAASLLAPAVPEAYSSA